MNVLKNPKVLRWICGVLAVATVVCLLVCKRKPSAEEQPEIKRTHKIAAILPTSGSNAAIGIGMMNSIELAINQANKSGELGEIHLELMRLDDASKPEQGVSVATRACGDPLVIASCSHWNSPVALATVDVFHKYRVPNLVPGTLNHKITRGNDYDEIFRIEENDIVQMEYAVKFAVNILQRKTFFLIDDNTAFGQSLVEQFEKFVMTLGGTILGKDSIQVGEQDFTVILTKIKDLAPDMLFFGGLYTEGALMRKQMMRLGLKCDFLGPSGIKSDKFMEIAGSAAEGAYCAGTGAPEIEMVPSGREYAAAYDAHYREPKEAFGILAYGAAQVLVEAIKQVGPDRLAITQELKRGTFDTVLGKVSFDEFGDNRLIFPSIAKVVNGNWLTVYVHDGKDSLLPYVLKK